MFKVGQKVLDKKTREKLIVIKELSNFYIIRNKSGFEIGKFEWELEKYNLIKIICKELKNKWKN
jgi:hypothetical protein